MKAVFVIRQGALVEGMDARCTLRCGASAGLRMLLDQDLRLIVIEGAVCSDVAFHNGSSHDGAYDGAYDNSRPGHRAIDEVSLQPSPFALATPEGAARNHRELAGNDHSARSSGRLPDNGRRRRRGDPPAAVTGAARHDDGDRHANIAASLSINYALTDTLSGRWRRVDTAADGGELRAPARCRQPSDSSGASDGLTVAEHGIDSLDIAGYMVAGEARFGAIAAGQTQTIGIRPNRTPTAGGAANSARVATGCDDGLAGGQRRTRMPGGGPPIIDRLGDLLFREQLILTAYYCCPHGDKPRRVSDPAPACFCLPPQPGLLLQAAYEHGIDLQSSWMIGARLDDIEAGNRSGCRTILIDNGTETAWRLGRARVPTRIAPDLHGAALLINDEGERMRR